MIVPLRFVLGLIVAAGALLLIALTGGGWWALDRLDPLLAVPGAGLAAMLGAIVAGRMRWWVALLWGVLASVAMIAVTWAPSMLLVQPRASVASALVYAAIALLLIGPFAAMVMWLLGKVTKWRRLKVIAIVLLVATAWQALSWDWIVPLYDMASSNRRVLLVSGLPLVDPIGQQPPEPIVTLLRRKTMLTIREAISDDDLAKTDVLLLIQPRALDPAELVRIDGWARNGGRVIIYADGLLVWPQRWPLGDPRNAPVTSLLTPLLSHWGLRLDAPPGLVARQVQTTRVWFRARYLAPGTFVREGQVSEGVSCSVSDDAFAAGCRVGRGQVFLRSDADMLMASLWQGTPAWHGGASAKADNADELLGMINDDAGRYIPSVWWHCNDCTR